MTLLDNERAQITFALIFIGLVDLVRDYFKKDWGDAVFVIILFFVLGPLWMWWRSRKSATNSSSPTTPA